METVTEDIAAEAMQNMDAAEVGRALRGFGLNLSCQPVATIAARVRGWVRGTWRRCGIPAVRHGSGRGRLPGRGGGMAHSAIAERQALWVARVSSAES